MLRRCPHDFPMRCHFTTLTKGGLPIIALHLGAGGAVVDIAESLVVRPAGQARAVVAYRTQDCDVLAEWPVDGCFIRCSVTCISSWYV